jgi:hypothetical protein
MNTRIDFSQAQWRKSTRSSASGSDCVEVAGLDEVIAVRDSKDPEGPKLFVGGATWRELTRRVAQGELDL